MSFSNLDKIDIFKRSKLNETQKQSFNSPEEILIFSRYDAADL